MHKLDSLVKMQVPQGILATNLMALVSNLSDGEYFEKYDFRQRHA